MTLQQDSNIKKSVKVTSDSSGNDFNISGLGQYTNNLVTSEYFVVSTVENGNKISIQFSGYN